MIEPFEDYRQARALKMQRISKRVTTPSFLIAFLPEYLMKFA